MPNKIFISHSEHDKPIVDSFVELLQTGANIPSTDIFCSSLEGMGIPTGENFIDFIKRELVDPKAVIVFMSKNYLNSQFCLCELGASWMLSNFILPILVEPLTFNDIKGVLLNTQAARLNHSDDLNNFIESLNKKIGNSKFRFPRWEAQRDKFLEDSRVIVDKLPKPEFVSGKEFQILKGNYEDAKKEISDLMARLENEKSLKTTIMQLKDKDEVRHTVLEHMTEKKKYDHVLSETREKLAKNDSIVNYALFKYYKDEEIRITNYFEQRELSDRSKEAVDNDYFIKNDDYYSLNFDDPTVTESYYALEELTDILESSSEEFISLLTNEYGLRPLITNQRYWEKVLELKINY